jgi:hypothetical protein
MVWTVNVYNPGESTPIFMDLLGTFDEVLTCIYQIAKAFGPREYSQAFDVPGSATSEEIERLGRFGAVRVEAREDA